MFLKKGEAQEFSGFFSKTPKFSSKLECKLKDCSLNSIFLAELQASEFKFSRNGKRTLKNPCHRLITRVFRNELELYPLEFSGLRSLEVGV